VAHKDPQEHQDLSVHKVHKAHRDPRVMAALKDRPAHRVLLALPVPMAVPAPVEPPERQAPLDPLALLERQDPPVRMEPPAHRALLALPVPMAVPAPLALLVLTAYR
jgi:hypothetical protein